LTGSFPPGQRPHHLRRREPPQDRRIQVLLNIEDYANTSARPFP
jgi:hypothetical protein